MSAVADPPAPAAWRAGLAASGAYLGLGLLASGVANRLLFAGWALAAAGGHLAVLHQGWGRWRRGRLGAALLAWAAVALLTFAAVVGRHQEALDLGTRALLWPLHHPALTKPAAWLVLAAAPALAAGALLARRSR